jgi:hypothetical protein
VRTSYVLERAWVRGEVRDEVLVEITDGRFSAVSPQNSRLDDETSSSRLQIHRPADESQAGPISWATRAAESPTKARPPPGVAWAPAAYTPATGVRGPRRRRTVERPCHRTP